MKFSTGLIVFGVIVSGVIYAIHCRVRYGDSARSFVGSILEFAAIGAAGFGVAWGILRLARGLGSLIG